MIGDANPMVVANAVAALSEIQEVSGEPVFEINSASLFKLLRALNECTEWGQVSVGGFMGGWVGCGGARCEAVKKNGVCNLGVRQPIRL
jgi:hypothetical protein